MKNHMIGATAIAALIVTTLSACASAAPAEESDSSAAPTTVNVATAGKWMDDYLDAWQTKDAEAVMALVSEDAVYQSVPGVASETTTSRCWKPPC